MDRLFDDPYCATNDCSSWGGTFDYTSGKLVTKNKLNVSTDQKLLYALKFERVVVIGQHFG